MTSIDGNDPKTVRLDQLQLNLGKSYYPFDQPKVNAIIGARGVFQELYVTGNTWLGPLQTAITLDNGISLPDGTAAAPSARFTNSTNTGLFLAGASSMGLTAGGVQQAAVGTSGLSITTQLTAPADLVINPTGPNVDFSGKNLVNVGSITPNPNVYDVIAGGVLLTTNASPLPLLSILTDTNAVYMVDTRVSYGIGATGASGVAIVTARIENYGGVLTLNTVETTKNYDVALATATVTYAINGLSVDVLCTGIAATNIKWFGKSSVVRCLFV